MPILAILQKLRSVDVHLWLRKLIHECHPLGMAVNCIQKHFETNTREHGNIFSEAIRSTFL